MALTELTGKQRQELKLLLVQLQKQIEVDLQTSTSSSQTVQLDTSIGRLSRMDAMQQQAMAKATRQNLKVRQAQIATALMTVDSEDFGYCGICEELIAYKRLLSQPETRFCVGCQGKREK